MNCLASRKHVMLPVLVAFAVLATGREVSAATTDSGVIAKLEVATVEQPRPFGYTIGDILTQRVLLQVNGKQFEPAAMPRSERVGAWLQRRAPRIETQPDGRRWLAVDYQIVNSPQSLKLVAVPAWELAAKSGPQVLRIGEWPISVSPLIPRQGFKVDSLDTLRPDRPAPVIATAPIERQIAVWSGASLLTLVAWLGWFAWRNWRTSLAQPFGRALREIRRLDNTSPQAWRALHRAFDRISGQVTRSATLVILFQRAPQLVPLRPKIEQFFDQSSEYFFGEGLPATPISVRELCTELRRIEKRHER